MPNTRRAFQSSCYQLGGCFMQVRLVTKQDLQLVLWPSLSHCLSPSCTLSRDQTSQLISFSVPMRLAREVWNITCFQALFVRATKYYESALAWWRMKGCPRAIPSCIQTGIGKRGEGWSGLACQASESISLRAPRHPYL